MSNFFNKVVQFLKDEQQASIQYKQSCEQRQIDLNRNLELEKTKLEIEEDEEEDSQYGTDEEYEGESEEEEGDYEDAEYEEESCEDCKDCKDCQQCEHNEEQYEYEEYTDNGEDVEEIRDWYEDLLHQRIVIQEMKEIQGMVIQHNLKNLLQDEYLLILDREQKYQEILFKLNNDQKILDYINIIWQDLYDPEMLIKHIQLLIKYEPQSIPEFIKHDKYPQNQIMELLQQSNVQEGVAILLVKQDKLDEAIQKYLEFLDDLIRYYIREQLRLPVQINKKRKPIYNYDIKQLLGKLNNIMKYINDTLLKYTNSDDNIDIQWFKVFHQLIDWQFWLNQVYSLQNKVELIQLLNFVRKQIPQVIYQLIQVTDIDLFINEFNEIYKKIDKGTFIYSYKQIVRELKYYFNILKDANKEFKQTNRLIREILQYRKSKGKFVEIQCTKCNLLCHMIINNQMLPAIQFNCGHVFHNNCLKQLECEICQTQQIYQLDLIQQQVKLGKRLINPKQIFKPKQIEQPKCQQIQQLTKQDKIKLLMEYSNKQKYKV